MVNLAMGGKDGMVGTALLLAAEAMVRGVWV